MWKSQNVRGIATSAIDISDGLLGDLGHILKQSGVGATVDTEIAINSIAAYSSNTCARDLFDIHVLPAPWLDWALAGGDDYELLFTAPPTARAQVAAAAKASQTPVTHIGHISAERGLR